MLCYPMLCYCYSSLVYSSLVLFSLIQKLKTLNHFATYLWDTQERFLVKTIRAFIRDCNISPSHISCYKCSLSSTQNAPITNKVRSLLRHLHQQEQHTEYIVGKKKPLILQHGELFQGTFESERQDISGTEASNCTLRHSKQYTGLRVLFVTHMCAHTHTPFLLVSGQQKVHYYLPTLERWRNAEQEREKEHVSSSLSSVSSASECIMLYPAFILPRVCRVFSTCMLYPHGQCDMEPKWKICFKDNFLQNKINQQGQLSLQNTSLKIVRIFCSVLGSFFGQRLLGPQHRNLLCFFVQVLCSTKAMFSIIKGLNFISHKAEQIRIKLT